MSSYDSSWEYFKSGSLLCYILWNFLTLKHTWTGPVFLAYWYWDMRLYIILDSWYRYIVIWNKLRCLLILKAAFNQNNNKRQTLMMSWNSVGSWQWVSSWHHCRWKSVRSDISHSMCRQRALHERHVQYRVLAYLCIRAATVTTFSTTSQHQRSRVHRLSTWKNTHYLWCAVLSYC